MPAVVLAASRGRAAYITAQIDQRGPDSISDIDRIQRGTDIGIRTSALQNTQQLSTGAGDFLNVGEGAQNIKIRPPPTFGPSAR